MVELIEISILKGNASMVLVNVDAKFVLNMLHSQVLSQRAELVINVFVVSSLITPFLLQHEESFFQNMLRTHITGIYSRSESEEGLFYLHGGTLNS